jgi:hypothetical protein
MPSQVVTANTTAQSVAAAVRNGVHKPTSLTIDNISGGGDRVITLQDVFTPSETNGDSSPTEQTVNRHKVTALQGDIMTLGEQDLAGVKCLGALEVVSDVTDASCNITVGYKTE